MFEDLIGKKIMIMGLKDEPNEHRYIGKTGIVKNIGVDAWGDEYLSGTWGGISIYPEYDDIKILVE